MTAGVIFTKPRATAVRVVKGLAETSTILTFPDSL
jgi:hypothetical protein